MNSLGSLHVKEDYIMAAVLTKIYAKIHSRYADQTGWIRKISLQNKNFTIISNNCWAGGIYRSYSLPYRTPTIGSYIMPDDYIKFVYNLKKYIAMDLMFVNPEQSKWYKYISQEPTFGQFPVGKLGDIEIIFLHYKSKEEAYEKWVRRCERINWDNILFKFNDQNCCKKYHLKAFDKLSYPNKICFTAKEHKELKTVIFIKAASKQSAIQYYYEPFGKSKHVNITKFINSMERSGKN